MASIIVNIAPNVLTWALKKADGIIIDTAMLLRVHQWIDG